MKVYVAVDCGKYNTKVAMVVPEKGTYKRFKFRTKIEEGTFQDDMLEKNSILVEKEGKVYKVGAGAKNEAAMETSKMSEVHKICTLTAIAQCVNVNEVVDICVVIGIPYQLCCVPETRIQYKDYILSEGSHSMKLKLNNEDAPFEVNFNIEKRLVYPESIGVLYMYPALLGEMVGIVDIGNLNINNTYCNKFEPIAENSYTGELGGKILISGLAQELSSSLGSRVDDNLVAAALLKESKNRMLIPANKDLNIQEKSKQVIDEFLLKHVREIKSSCDVKHWPLNFMQLAFIGGTTKLLKEEIKVVFGENVFIPDDPEYVNAEGFLKKLCASVNIDVDAIKAGKGDKKKGSQVA